MMLKTGCLATLRYSCYLPRTNRCEADHVCFYEGSLFLVLETGGFIIDGRSSGKVLDGRSWAKVLGAGGEVVHAPEGHLQPLPEKP